MNKKPDIDRQAYDNLSDLRFIPKLQKVECKNAQLEIQIVEKDQTIKLLQESEEKYRSLFENMLNGFALCQMVFEDGLPDDFMYINVNKAFERLTGLSNVEGKKISEVIPGVQETDSNLIETYGRVALTGKPEFLEKYVASLNEWFSLSIYSPKTGYFIAIFDVITERKQYELKLIQAKEKAEESDRLKTAFLNNISHEIRTPFNGILGLLSLFQENDLDKSERDEYIDIINQSAQQLMGTINDIVEIAQIQSRQIKMCFQPTDIKILTDDLVNQFQHKADRKGLKFTVNNMLGVEIISVYTDAEKLKTIASNLLNNAFKFTTAGSIHLWICLKENFLEFSVHDTGIGISENKLEVIFERFMQSNVSNTRQFEGMGLGLSIAKEYVNMFGGRLWVKSEEGKGSTFYFTIPYLVNPE